MRATLLDTHCLTAGPAHHAFTTLCRWRDRIYCAWRAGLHHGITPPGHVAISRLSQEWPPRVCTNAMLNHPIGDVRDPRLVPTPDALWCFAGVYLPTVGVHQAWHGLSAVPTDNIVQTHVAWTTDGLTWTPLVPILRPNFWAWGIIVLNGLWFVATYQQGTAFDTATTLTLFSGLSPLRLAYAGTIYDGFNFAKDGEQFRYPHSLPCEPVLWPVSPHILACAVRTETGMDLGVARTSALTDWRWHTRRQTIAPSAVYVTAYGTLLAGRAVAQYAPSRRDRDATRSSLPQTTWRTSLYHLVPGTHWADLLLTLPSHGDTGYAGLCAGLEPNTVLVSYYTSVAESFLPGTDVWLAHIRIMP